MGKRLFPHGCRLPSWGASSPPTARPETPVAGPKDGQQSLRNYAVERLVALLAAKKKERQAPSDGMQLLSWAQRMLERVSGGR